MSLDYSGSEIYPTRFLFGEKLRKYAEELSLLVIKAPLRPPAENIMDSRNVFYSILCLQIISQDKTYIPSHR